MFPNIFNDYKNCRKELKYVRQSLIIIICLNPNSIGGGGGGLFWPCDAKFSEKCPCSHNNDTALIKLISLFATALVMTYN